MRPDLLFANAQILSLALPNLLLRDLPLSPAPTPAAQLKDNPSCLLLGEALAICGSLTPGFKNLSPPNQAQCLCYSSTVWAPTLFDSAVKSCADFASASATSAYSALANIEGFCTSIGDVAKVPASNTATPTTTAPTPFPVAACDSMVSFLSSCAKSTPGFNTMLAVDQSKCLCHSGARKWNPDAFDKAVDTCFEVAKNASIPAMIASASMLEGFCSSVGDIENPNTGALPATTFSTPPSLVASPAFITQPASPARISGQSSETQSSQSQVAAPALMPVFTFTPPTVLAALPPISSPIINAAPSSTPATIPILGDPSVQSGPSHSLSSGNSAFASGDSGSISASTASSPSAHKTPTTLQQTTASSSTTTKSSTLQVSEGDSLQSLTKATQFEVILISGACAVVLLFLC